MPDEPRSPYVSQGTLTPRRVWRLGPLGHLILWTLVMVGIAAVTIISAYR